MESFEWNKEHSKSLRSEQSAREVELGASKYDGLDVAAAMHHTKRQLFRILKAGGR